MAARFWVGGTGTWDAADTDHWSATSGGAGGQSVPVAADTVTLDASSGGGTVTVNHATLSVTSITMGAFTGTLDFSVNNNNVTLGTFSGAGTGVRTLNLGDGTWTITSPGSMWNNSTVTNLTFDANSSTILISNTSSGNARTFFGGGLTYNILSIAASGAGANLSAVNITGANTFAQLQIAGNNCVTFAGGVTNTISSAFTLVGSVGNPITLASGTVGNTATVSIASGAATIAHGFIRDLTFAGGATFSATNSYDLGHNTGITITPPAVGGGGSKFDIFSGMLRIPGSL